MTKSNWRLGCLLLGLCYFGGMCTVWLAQAMIQHLSWR